MRYISELIDSRRTVKKEGNSVVLTGNAGNVHGGPYRINLLALGDVGGMLLTGLRLAGDIRLIERIGIFDINEKMMRRYEREINQICYPEGRQLPPVEMLQERELFQCDMFIFCASRGVPPVGVAGDVRMMQLEANRELIASYASEAAKQRFDGIFAVVSDPVDPLCKAALNCGLGETQVQGYGLGVMNGRAMYHAGKDRRFEAYPKEGRAFGPHGEDLVIADSVVNYNHELSMELTSATVKSNLNTRADGFKPYIAPALSSGALSIMETLKGNWNYSSVYLGKSGTGAFLGCRNRRRGKDIQMEDLPLEQRLFERIQKAYRKLEVLEEVQACKS